MQEILQEQADTVQKLSSEIKSAENHFMLKGAAKPLRLVLGFMRNVVRTAIETEKRLKALEEAKCTSFEPVDVCADCDTQKTDDYCGQCGCYHMTIKCKNQIEGANHAK